MYVSASMPRRYSKAETDRFLKGRHVAVLGTNAADGAPVLTPIWYLYRDGVILMRTDEGSVKTRNIERDPRVTVCVQDERPPYASVTIYGKAYVQPADQDLGAAMAKHYLGAVGAQGYLRAAREAIERGAEVTLVIKPERTLTQDFSLETPWFGKLWLTLKRVLPPQL
jgi:PPOX class probable F420-dependent enzyme